MATPSRVGMVLRVTSGNFMEMFDFFLFGFYATAIAKTFFPADNEVASLMMTLMTFGAGFLMRPLGAIVLGAYVDRVGRRQGLIVTLALMALGTILIACVLPIVLGIHAIQNLRIVVRCLGIHTRDTHSRGKSGAEASMLPHRRETDVRCPARYRCPFLHLRILPQTDRFLFR